MTTNLKRTLNIKRVPMSIRFQKVLRNNSKNAFIVQDLC